MIQITGEIPKMGDGDDDEQVENHREQRDDEQQNAL